MDQFLREIRFGFRALQTKPALSALAVLALAIGIGLTTSMFSVANGILFKGESYEYFDRLMHLTQDFEVMEEGKYGIPFTDLKRLNEESKTFEGFSAWYSGTVNLSGNGLPQRYDGAFISGNFLDLLGVKPLHGRCFNEADCHSDSGRVILIGYNVWKHRYYGDPKIIGKSVRVNGVESSIVGVMPRDFKFPINQEIWLPLEQAPTNYKEKRGMAFGRIKKGVRHEEAEAELVNLSKKISWSEGEQEMAAGYTLGIKPFTRLFVSKKLTKEILLCMSTGIFVLLIACANVANLLLARSTLRAKEMAVRSALGATRFNIIRQLLVESLILAGFGAIGGLILTSWGVDFLWSSAQRMDPPYWMNFSIDGNVLLFVVFITLFAGIISGIVPAWEASRTNVMNMLKDASATSSGFSIRRFSKFLAVVQIAISTALLIGAGLTIKTLVNLHYTEIGFNPEKLLTVRMGLFPADYPDNESRLAFYNKLVRNLSYQTGVEAAAMTRFIFLSGRESGGWKSNCRIEGKEYAPDEDLDTVVQTSVSASFLTALNIPLVEGKFFCLLDEKEKREKVAIVNESFAKKMWPGQSAIGKRLKYGEKLHGIEHDMNDQWLKIVGVVKDFKITGHDSHLRSGVDDILLEPFWQEEELGFATLIVRTYGDPKAAISKVRQQVQAIDPHLPIYFAKSMNEYFYDSSYFYRLIAGLFSIFGIMALFLASVGIYGVMSFSVTQRTREIGIRMALGAKNKSILNLILKQGAIQVFTGLAIGIPMAFALANMLKYLLYGVKPNDLPTFVAVIVCLAIVALLACYLPAWRATKVQPMDALRYQ